MILSNDPFRVWRRLSGIISLIILAIVPVSAQVKPGDSALTARSVFERLQGPALELLKPTSRLDMLDYWDTDSVYRVKNALNGQSWLETVAPDYLKVNITPVSTLEIKLLPVKKGEVIMTIYTVGGDGQARDSRIEFYDPATLAPIDGTAYFTEPDLKVFFDIPKGSLTSMKEIREMIPFMTVEYGASSGSNDLTAKMTAADYINVDDRNIVKVFLLPEVKTQWKEKYKF
ncbi:MAG: DUF3256 family protein [Muribaculaceae bacterium]|nr:DUF3256 family protein [Muribaculaceae bacterium]